MAKNIDKEHRPSRENVEKFEMLFPLLNSLLEEIREFSKKKPDGVLSKLKVGTVNRILKDVKEFLTSDPSVAYLDLLDDETLPQNGDATLILGQFRAAMVQYKRKHYGYNSNDHEHGWYTTSGFVSRQDITGDRT